MRVQAVCAKRVHCEAHRTTNLKVVFVYRIIGVFCVALCRIPKCEAIMSVHCLRGGEAFPEFRRRILEKSVADAVGFGVGVDAVFVYFLNVGAEPPAGYMRMACELLSAGEDVGADEDAFYVSPRKGTISPWSSKATDIFRNCGLGTVQRVERAVRMVVRRRSDGAALTVEELRPALGILHDRMTEGVYYEMSDLFDMREPAPGRVFDVLSRGADALREANISMGLALSEDEIEYLRSAYTEAGRNPTDTELVMFGQVNSEHCRHKIFNAGWVVDGKPEEMSLFSMIRNTHKVHPEGTLVAYADNSGVVEGFDSLSFDCDPVSHRYRFRQDRMDILMKVETHNHPTAISPFPGAATGVGGEIRDEAATGIGSKSKAGICGFIVSHLRLPGYRLPWERETSAPSRLASPLAIMTEGPIGGASFGNEFGRPQLCGFFRTYEEERGGRSYGYNKPVMLAGGMGFIRRMMVSKKDIPAGSLVVQIGGPAMRIGLGGGAASSLASGNNAEELDFDSVQRGNAEMQRRCQEVIDACVALGDRNPILSIHDIGAGGLSNGCPELIEKTGGKFELRAVHNEEPSMSPMEIWCCEAQERYVLAVRPEDRCLFESLCRRERCPVAFIGVATGDHRLVLEDSFFGNRPIDMEVGVLLGKPPRMTRNVSHVSSNLPPVKIPDGVTAADAFKRVIQHPAVADKTFLVTIADRSITGMVCRDQMCGPYQLPVADYALTATGYTDYTGSAMACGERPPVAAADAPASGRLAVAEAILNIAPAGISRIGDIKLSANWMCACGEDGEDAALFDTVKAVGMEFCPAVGVSIPVGKDSLSMRTMWNDAQTGVQKKQISPLTLVVSAFSPVSDVRKSVTPDLKKAESDLVFVDLSAAGNPLGGSIFAQTWNLSGNDVPDVSDPVEVRTFVETLCALLAEKKILAAHDRSDGGLAAALAEMAISGGVSCTACVDSPERDGALAAMFTEGPGMVLQTPAGYTESVVGRLREAGLRVRRIGQVIPEAKEKRLEITYPDGASLFSMKLNEIRALWSENSVNMRMLRDNPACGAQERANAVSADDPGMTFNLTYDASHLPSVSGCAKPVMAILREQGVNGQVEMAAAFSLAGFETVDVHMTDLLNRDVRLSDFCGLVACGGFSYGDVLGAGSGWARSILFNAGLREEFEKFFRRPDTFTLGVCNGCQMVSQLKDIIPGADGWPSFAHNLSEQFEARYVTVEVMDSPSILLRGMAGSRIPIPVAHGEGRAVFAAGDSEPALEATSRVCVRYVDNSGFPTERYPFNPNGSEGGATGFTTRDGRVTIMMPHAERAFRSVQLSWRPSGIFEGEEGPWMRLFRNAREFVG